LGSGQDKLKLKKDELIFLSQKLNGCFAPETLITMSITMSDGSNKRIKNIEIGDEVLSFDETTFKITPKRVKNTFDNGVKPMDEWIQINCETARGRTQKSKLIVTKNHKIFTKSGRVKAGQLSKGDSICTRKYKLSQTQIDALVGIGLGDGQRNDFWARRDELIGKIVEVKYKEVSKNKDTGLESLQFPVFVRLRADKEQVSYE